METLDATFRIVTPMFLGDANQGVADGVRPPSVKGALRFWWRALNWGRLRSQASCDEAGLIFLHMEECRLFGSAANDKDRRGQGCFLLSVKHDQLDSTKSQVIHEHFRQAAAARYLGYGLMVAYGRDDGPAPSGKILRDCLTEGQEFTVKLVFRDRIESSVKEALIAWGLLGGLGSRSRHGMGCIALSSLKVNGNEEWTMQTTANDYDAKIKELFSATILPTELPPFSAFWQDARIDRLLSANDCYKVLDDFGKAMLMYRSWGKTDKGNKLPGGGVSEERFKDDHDWCRATKDERKRDYVNFHPARVVFGLPHNYGQSPNQKVNGESHERRSSPLLFHVHPVGTTFVGVSVYLPAQFLPQGEKINAGGSFVDADIMWSIIPCFLDGKVGNLPLPGAKDRFPTSSKKAVLP